MKIRLNAVKYGVVDWHRWFAFYPVRVSASEIAWFEYVERRQEVTDSMEGPFTYNWYRPIGSARGPVRY